MAHASFVSISEEGSGDRSLDHLEIGTCPCDSLFDVQNAAFTNQSGEDTNLIGECGRESQRNL